MEISKPVVWFEIYVDNMSRAQKFYEEVFQTKLEKLPMPDTMGSMLMHAFPSSENSKWAAAWALVYMEGCKSGWSSTIVYFSSEDCSIEESRVINAGGKIHRKKTSLWDYGNMTLAVDTEWNMIGIHSMK